MQISECRLCETDALEVILELGNFIYSGIFPDKPWDETNRGNLTLVLCMNCTLLQLSENFPKSLLYGDNYGYRSGLNSSMIEHLEKISYRLLNKINIEENDIFLDIGSNDGTLLNSIGESKITRIGIDPTANKFKEYYKEGTVIVSDFFTNKNFMEISNKKAKIITSIAMFYDLITPLEFVQDIKSVLANDGVWYFEQSYMPWMVRNNAYDTICHEHLEYYSLTSINRLLNLAELEIIDIEFNNANGGSIGVYATHKSSNYFKINPYVNWQLSQESSFNLKDSSFFSSFVQNVEEYPHQVNSLLDQVMQDGYKVLGIGASTKGSILAQHCKLDCQKIPMIGEVNNYKFNKYLGGSDIPIVQENSVLDLRPDYLFIFPWHFKENLKQRFTGYLNNGGRLILPLPSIEIISSS